MPTLIERLYRLPDGSALLLSDVRSVMPRPINEFNASPYVTLMLPRCTLDVHFATNADAHKFVDKIIPLVDEARAAAGGVSLAGE